MIKRIKASTSDSVLRIPEKSRTGLFCSSLDGDALVNQRHARQRNAHQRMRHMIHPKQAVCAPGMVGFEPRRHGSTCIFRDQNLLKTGAGMVISWLLGPLANVVTEERQTIDRFRNVDRQRRSVPSIADMNFIHSGIWGKEAPAVGSDRRCYVILKKTTDPCVHHQPPTSYYVCFSGPKMGAHRG